MNFQIVIAELIPLYIVLYITYIVLYDVLMYRMKAQSIYKIFMKNSFIYNYAY